jgi:PII-like signaling protein
VSIEHNGTLMRIYVSESARAGTRSMVDAVIEALSSGGIAGAIAFKGIEGYGRGGIVSSSRTAEAWSDFPILIEVVDDDEKIRAFMPVLEAIVDEGLVTLERVQTLFCRGARA